MVNMCVFTQVYSSLVGKIGSYVCVCVYACGRAVCSWPCVIVRLWLCVCVCVRACVCVCAFGRACV